LGKAIQSLKRKHIKEEKAPLQLVLATKGIARPDAKYRRPALLSSRLALVSVP
jgi:hypothetical protein